MHRHPFLVRNVSRLGDLVDRVAHDAPAGRSGVLVALSGGPDSVALLLVAHAWAAATGRPVAAAHLDHRLRGDESAGDAAFCRELCDRLGVVLHLRVADPRAVARSRGRGLEEAGRHLRLRLLGEILAADGRFVGAATGHHADDQAETVLMRLLRGAGLDGVAALRPVAGRLLHPLLPERRADILEFLAAVGQPWRHDRTNAADDATRNRVRRELLPLVRDIFGSGAEAAPARFAELAAADLDLLAVLTRRALAWCDADAGTAPPPPVPLADDEPRDPAPAALTVSRLLALDEGLARRVLRRWLAQLGGTDTDWEAVHVTGTLAWLRTGQSGQGLDLPHGVRLARSFDRLQGGATTPPPAFPHGDGTAFRIVVTPGELAAGTLPAAATACAGPELVCPAGALHGSVRVRNWRPGDRLVPFGLGGTKKVSDLLQARRVPADLREGVLVVEDESGILWVVGVERAERTRLLPSTTRVVTISLHERPSPARGYTGPRSRHARDRKGSGG